MATAAGYRMPIFEPDSHRASFPLHTLALVVRFTCRRNACAHPFIISNTRPCLFRRLVLQRSQVEDVLASCMLRVKQDCEPRSRRGRVKLDTSEGELEIRWSAISLA